LSGKKTRRLMLGIGIIGANYGRNVLLPAFRSDPRCEVAALAASTEARSSELARSSGIARAFENWEELVDHDSVSAVAIAVPPDLQPAMARRALERGKPVFVEKPLAPDLAAAGDLLATAQRSGRPHMIDFNFPELSTWQRAKDMIAGGEIGRLRHVVATWNMENAAVRMGVRNWKTTPSRGGGILGNFVSHCFHYLEWFCGPICGLGGRVFTLSDGETQGSIALAFVFASGAGGSLQMSCASFLGSGHRIELYGEDGTLVLNNPTSDYFRGFKLMHARRGASSLRVAPIPDDTVLAGTDSRVVPVSRLIGRFIDGCIDGKPVAPGFVEGYRVQYLIDAAWRAHCTGRWIDVAVSEHAS
jgi:predicted dehydrogenase